MFVFGASHKKLDWVSNCCCMKFGDSRSHFICGTKHKAGARLMATFRAESNKADASRVGADSVLLTCKNSVGTSRENGTRDHGDHMTTEYKIRCRRSPNSFSSSLPR
jgi:hypothetical protein